ncbi:4'-phosphopantetheinyl transferase family protein, partial [Duganella hordei]|uniref:4'-phosphopantetheinyl transferase family protein n=1 Tax=Duganella hordei TaxID=2865934 RepID=UPI003340501E
HELSSCPIAGTDPALIRSAQRANIRRAAREVLAALTGEPASCFGIQSQPGGPLNVIVGGHDSTIGCSFSHEDGYSLAAIHLHGAIGVDMMRVQDIPDWEAVARDYLGPTVTAALQATPAAERPLAFALAWTRREAELKCRGSQLAEWPASGGTGAVTAIPLIMKPAGLAGHVAIYQGGSK